jgi:hypothetical protein
MPDACPAKGGRSPHRNTVSMDQYRKRSHCFLHRFPAAPIAAFWRRPLRRRRRVHRLRPERRGGVRQHLRTSSRGTVLPGRKKDGVGAVRWKGRVLGANRCAVARFSESDDQDGGSSFPEAGANAVRKALRDSRPEKAGASGCAGPGPIRPPSPGSGPGYGAAHRAPQIPRRAGCGSRPMWVTVPRANGLMCAAMR